MAAAENSVRKADHAITRSEYSDKYKTKNFTFTNVSGDPQGSVLEDRAYPYAGQEVIRAEFDYENESSWGTATGRGQIEIRTGSDLFVLKKESGSASRDKIYNCLNSEIEEVVGEDIDIYETIRSNISDIWKFTSKASSVYDAVVDKGGVEHDYDSLREDGMSHEEITSDYLLMSANLKFRTPESELVTVKYDEGSISVRYDNNRQFEYVTQLFESILIK